jgi:hypothetical protein
MLSWLLTRCNWPPSHPVTKIVQPGRLSHQGWYHGETNSWATFKLQEDGFLITLKEQVTGNHTRWSSPVTVRNQTTVRESSMYLTWPADTWGSWPVSQPTGWDPINYLMANIHNLGKKPWQNYTEFTFWSLLVEKWHCKDRGSQSWENLLLKGKTGKCLQWSLMSLK